MPRPGFLKYTAPWYSGYAFQGAVVLGLSPILLPIVVGSALGAAKAGSVVAAFYVGQLLAPLLGSLTDRFSLHRRVYAAGYILLALGLGLFPELTGFGFWMLLAFIQGAGSAATNTVAAMFIVEWQRKEEWDSRIGWLQTFYGLGQAIGLGLAAWLQASPAVGLWVAAALMAPGLALGMFGLPKGKKGPKPEKPAFAHEKHNHPRRILGFLHRYQRLPATFKELARHLSGPFGLYIVSWLFTMLGTWIIYNLYPLMMRSAYGIGQGASSTWYAAAAALGVLAYAPSGALGKKIGDGWVVMIGTLMTVVSVGAMGVLAYVDTGMNQLLAPLAFVLTPIAWSPLIVGGTAYTAQLATMDEGTAVGLFNAATAVGSVVSALGAGFLAEWFGYRIVPVAGAALTVLGALLLLPLVLTHKKKRDGQGAGPE